MIKDLIYAGFSAIWHRSVELDEAQLDLTKVCDQEGWTWYVWDCVRGLRFIDKDTKMWKGFEKSQNPLAPVTQDFPKTEEDQRNVVLLHNYHRFLENPQVVQAVINAALRGKSVSTHYVVLSPVSEMPVELERTFTVVEHPLPGEKELSSIAEELARDASVPIEQGSIEAAKGLTRKQAENAFSLSIRNHGKVEAGEVWDLKRGFVNDRGYLSFSRGGPGFDSIGGLHNLKDFTKRILRKDSKVPPKGVMLLGPPGCGKSAFCRALGNETGRPTLTLDFGALFHKHVGETERQLRDALGIIDAIGQSVVFVD